MRRLIFLLFCIGLCTLIIPVASFAARSDDTELTNYNKQRCEEWCTEHKQKCDFCSHDSTCGPRYSVMASFGAGTEGAWSENRRHWYACSGGDDDRRNQQACESWCNSNKPSCIKCAPKTGCGQGYKSINTFGGKGKNWHGCTKTDFRAGSDALKAECMSWCEANRGAGCVHCDTRRNCGGGYETMKHFGGQGWNWHACRRK